MMVGMGVGGGRGGHDIMSHHDTFIRCNISTVTDWEAILIHC